MRVPAPPRAHAGTKQRLRRHRQISGSAAGRADFCVPQDICASLSASPQQRRVCTPPLHVLPCPGAARCWQRRDASRAETARRAGVWDAATGCVALRLGVWGAAAGCMGRGGCVAVLPLDPIMQWLMGGGVAGLTYGA
mmetsp:Transcript_7841/g.23587  ORF Transcript_7841/g.23587 Transcript_7841/m.23587 type:complete len:138 (-) Transcript_7841:3765-4178(-)